MSLGGFGLVSQAKPNKILGITISPTPIAGTTNPAAGQYPFPSEETLSVSESPNGGYTFFHWELDGKNIGSANPIGITVGDENHQLIAVFYINSLSLYEFGGHVGPPPPPPPVPPPPFVPPPFLQKIPYGYYKTPYTQEIANIDGAARSEALAIKNV